MVIYCTSIPYLPVDRTALKGKVSISVLPVLVYRWSGSPRQAMQYLPAGGTAQIEGEHRTRGPEHAERCTGTATRAAGKPLPPSAL